MYHSQKLLSLTYYYLIVILSICFQTSMASISLEQEDIAQSTRFVIVPGQNGMGGIGLVDKKIINPAPGTQIFVKTPESIPDLGQSHCQKYLADTLMPLEKNEEVKNIIVHATSQGTATVLNYLAKNNLETKVRAIILESILVSGNSAIHHTVKSLISEIIADLPDSYYWLPYIAKLIFPLYNPAGEQAIFSCKNLPSNIPVIIVYATEDPQLPYDDALALYYKLNQNFNLNIYFMSIEGRQHFNLLNQRFYPGQIAAINQIFKNHDLPFYPEVLENKSINLYAFQPNPNNYEQNYRNLIAKETKFRTINFLLTKAMPVFILVYMCTYFFN